MPVTHRHSTPCSPATTLRMIDHTACGSGGYRATLVTEDGTFHRATITLAPGHITVATSGWRRTQAIPPRFHTWQDCEPWIALCLAMIDPAAIDADEPLERLCG